LVLQLFIANAMVTNSTDMMIDFVFI